MRSQTSKPIPKKGSLSKTTFKTNPHGKLSKKKALLSKSTKKANVNKAVGKSNKKNSSKEEDKNSSSSDCSSATSDKNVGSDVSAIAGTSKETDTKIESCNKKPKKDIKEKKEQAKANDNVGENKNTVKKTAKTTKKKLASKSKTNSDTEDNDNIKYKINLDVIPKNPSKGPKGKTFVKKKNAPVSKKKGSTSPKSLESSQKKDIKTDIDDTKKDNTKAEVTQIKASDESDKNNKEVEKISTSESKMDSKNKEVPKSNQPDISKPEHERPPKFFTSMRSPRTVDIDVKCFKNSKGNLSVSERFLSMKCESKTEDKTPCNTLVSQGPEMDVYTFTEKVDSPKSILSDFRSPISKTIGRVRPIARVKGTVIDKNMDTERKKYSPHRPIEEVVKQLKASKQTDDQNKDQDVIVDALKICLNAEKTDEDNTPKPIVSKSYKMVARKSSVTGKPFSPLKFESESSAKTESTNKSPPKKPPQKSKKQQKKFMSDDELDTCKFSFNNSKFNYPSSDESVSESNDDRDSKESSESDSPKTKKNKTKKYKRITDGAKKSTSKELKELSKDSLIDLKEASTLLGGEKPSKRRLKLLSMWSGPKKHRMASLNAIAKVHCLYENESRTHMELGLMKTVDRQVMPSTSKAATTKKKEIKPKEVEKVDSSTSESEYENVRNKKDESSESSDDSPPQRSLRGEPGIRSAGKYWDPKSCSSSSEESEHEFKKKVVVSEKKKSTVTKTKNTEKSDSDKPSSKMKKTAGVPVKKKRNRNEVVMDLKDMVVQKRMASLNATAILAASYEKRSPKSSKEDTTSDSCSDESFSQKSKNLPSSAVKSEVKKEVIPTANVLTKKEVEDPATADVKQKVEVIVNQDTDVTITGVYSTHHHEGFCTVSGLQYRISSTSHTQTTATANCDKEGCSRDDARYTPLSALSSMQPPEHAHAHPHPVGELGRRPGCSSAFSAPSPSAHHEPGKPKRKCNCRGCETTPYNPYGYYQPAGPLIKETSADADRALARYHPPHYHAPHPPMIQQYGPSYYPADLCYGRYYRPPGPYHMPAPDAQIVGVGSEPYPSQFYGTPPCYQHSQRIPYVEYRACPCPLNACPKNVHIGPATGKPPTGAGPDVAAALAPPGGAFRVNTSDSLARGKDPPLSPQLSAASDAGAAWGARGAGGVSPARERPALPGERPAPPALPGERPALPAARPPAPPSPARGEAGACAPHPPTPAPRKARLGKAMARRSLAREETTNIQQLTLPKAPPTPDDEVIPISPPECNPIDLSSDERSTPLVDVKKENEGPTQTSPRKPDAQALREHNTSVETSDPLKPTRRRYSRPKLEIDMKDVTLEESLKTNGIGEHVKLQKRRKVSGDQPEPPRIETVTRDPKRKTPSTPRRTLKTPPAEKRCPKRKLDVCGGASKPKKLLLSSPIKDDPRLKNIAALPEETHILTANAKSAPAVLDNLLRKNSINRDESVLNIEKNPAELFLSSKEKSLHNPDVKIHSINNNILQNSNSVKEVLTSIASVENQLLKKKVQNKSSCKLDVVADSKITVNSKSLRPPVDKSEAVDEPKISVPNNATELNSRLTSADNSDSHSETCKNKCDIIKSDHFNCENSISNKCDKVTKPTKAMKLLKSPNKIEMKTPVEETPGLPSDTSLKTSDAVAQEITEIDGKLPIRSIPSNEIKGKTVEKLVKLLASKRAAKLEESNQDLDMLKDKKRSKLGVEKSAGKEKVAKLLVSKKSAIKTDTASLVIEDACSSWRRGRGRRAGPRRRPAPEPSPPAPALAPRWSNGWTWHGHHYISRVYLNNDSRMDRTARCWARMTHASGDSVSKGDCVLLRANVARAQPFVARVASLWENPEDGEMMVSLVWYYRPEHTELGRQPTDAPDEVFASKHRDANSVACIEDKCYVLTFNEYCRYRKRLKAAEECVHIKPSIVPPMPASEVTPAIAPNDSKLPPAVSPELVLFCRKIYDFRSKKLQVPNK